ncbi:MAG: hypothetical protein ACJATT_002879 [Myxococcota bacterium]
MGNTHLPETPCEKTILTENLVARCGRTDVSFSNSEWAAGENNLTPIQPTRLDTRKTPPNRSSKGPLNGGRVD